MLYAVYFFHVHFFTVNFLCGSFVIMFIFIKKIKLINFGF